MQEPQYLTLHGDKDGKKWVAEITGEDPTFKLKRTFLPEINPNTYAIYDGYYQIYGQCPGISPFEKEYCWVIDGHMHRHLSFRQVLGQLDQIKALDDQRTERIKVQIKAVLDAIANELDHELVDQDMAFQKESIDFMDDFDALAAGYSQLIKQKEQMIQRYQNKLDQLPEDYV
ncbi:hypothetical protein [Aerococcus kribbianus]|uniref:Uncharacterized protein n=1 Tax=Aerococcus kribbianus TaxID=2999064 RepID=A0A9X3FNA2_9LACT|nr:MULTISPECIES: hypothetical protein [unclassified Aerococcus]MCZ0717399.1 hypothetical protein [Aerococcus sp. YH-aer221]MCZ0725687.1 hypothetical protein [Aerococcus sp. YH-aer222]